MLKENKGPLSPQEIERVCVCVRDRFLTLFFREHIYRATIRNVDTVALYIVTFRGKGERGVGKLSLVQLEV